MKVASRLVMVGMLASAGAISVFAQQAANPPASSAHDDVATLKEQLAAQQKQIEQLVTAMANMQKRMDQSASGSQTAVNQNPDAGAGVGASVGQVASITPVIPVIKPATDASLMPLPGKPAAAPAAAPQVGKKETLSDLAYGKIKIGGTFYGDWGLYTNTGFGPQFLTQINQEGPGNAGFDSFDVTRTYINFLYTPNDAVTLRFTPNVYRQVDVSSALGNGKGAGIGSSSNGNLGFRLKYAYVQFNTLFKGSDAFKKDNLRLGQQMNPLVDWEEGLYGYRYVNLTPWNYLSLSSTYTGAALNGPIEFNGKEYLDYQLGLFNTASFHAIEQNDRKQAMARLTWYPTGTKSDRTGFGLTAFMDYGYTTKTPDTRSIPLYRLALLGHFQTHDHGYLIAGEYDRGWNAFGTGNLFSGAGPADEFGLGPSPYATFDGLAKAILGGEHVFQQGYSFFGHARIGKSPFALFGMFHSFQPNTNIAMDPLDFRRTVGGISYHFNDHLDLSLDNQNLKYTQSQFTMTAAQLATFSSSLAKANPGGIPNAVPTGTNAIFVNVLFNY